MVKIQQSICSTIVSIPVIKILGDRTRKDTAFSIIRYFLPPKNSIKPDFLNIAYVGLSITVDGNKNLIKNLKQQPACICIEALCL